MTTVTTDRLEPTDTHSAVSTTHRLSRALRIALADRDVKPTELARHVGVSPQTIHRLLRGEKKIVGERAEACLNALGLVIHVSIRDRDPEGLEPADRDRTAEPWRF